MTQGSLDIKDGYKQDYFGNDFIGQKALRKRLNFMVDGQKQTQFIENLLFTSRYGAGKTFACRKIMENLTDERGQIKKRIEINSASLQNVSDFFSQIILPHVANGEKASIFLDELDCASPKIHQTLLTILQYDAHTKQSQIRDNNGVILNFSFKNLSVLASTTDPQKIHPALLSRFRQLEMEEYTNEELCQILFRYTPGITYLDGIEFEIIKTSRKSPRHISLRLANDINQYCSQQNKQKFTPEDWNKLRHLLRILPHGISENEYMLLKILRESPCTLTNLCGKMGMETSALRKRVEAYPIAESYIKIEGKRHITQKGMELLKEIDAFN